MGNRLCVPLTPHLGCLPLPCRPSESLPSVFFRSSQTANQGTLEFPLTPEASSPDRDAPGYMTATCKDARLLIGNFPHDGSCPLAIPPPHPSPNSTRDTLLSLWASWAFTTHFPKTLLLPKPVHTICTLVSSFKNSLKKKKKKHDVVAVLSRHCEHSWCASPEGEGTCRYRCHNQSLVPPLLSCYHSQMLGNLHHRPASNRDKLEL